MLGFGGGWGFFKIYFLTLKIARELNRSGEGFEEQETISTLTITPFTFTHQVTNRCTGAILHLRNTWYTRHEEVEWITQQITPYNISITAVYRFRIKRNTHN